MRFKMLCSKEQDYNIWEYICGISIWKFIPYYNKGRRWNWNKKSVGVVNKILLSIHKNNTIYDINE